VLSEVLYAASRIYSVAGFAEHNRMALDLVLWIKNVAEVAEITLDIALRAGELKEVSRDSINRLLRHCNSRDLECYSSIPEN